ncbi:SPW repeat-containing protein [Pontibacter ummariensis]|uniref:SPW repeat-containing protein n=1 Tax=Pontibacter ummariensis TaxID=1610492 RepID=A0A239EZ41_9BACT|nr:SPW repeat protein [Pontibacter ummariensis]PRY12674.1 SPW repeat-containing protein [Pontibacter ummariensis]SNS49899.1 SPW repeat-containing protein [Pontibacter ummariensis]
MRFIPTRFHGILDYIVGLVFIIAPWIFGFSDVSYATWTMVAAGVIVLLQAVMTDFEVGMVHKIPMQTHLLLDFGLGVILAVSPWMFNFAEWVMLPHLIGGVYLVLGALTTHRIPSESYRTRHTSAERAR